MQRGSATRPLLDWYGAIAQLGERLHGMQEVSGSIPLGSTNFPPQQRNSPFTTVSGKLVEPSGLAYAALACGQGGLATASWPPQAARAACKARSVRAHTQRRLKVEAAKS